MTIAPSETTGATCAAELAPLLERYGARRIFLVTGKRSFELSGASVAISPLLKSRSVTHFNDFSPNPTLEEVETGLALYRSARPDLVLTIGGGSAMDLGKMINALASSKKPLRDLLTGVAAPEDNPLPLVAIPTTAGSGAEVTHFSAVYVDGKKFSVTHESLRPTHHILDASLTASLPTYLTAATGMDALAQAIESYWSVRSTPESRLHSSRAIELCNGALVEAATASSDAARTAMMQASYSAGMAIDIARTTAPHALSYILTTDFGVTHGHAVALTLGAVFAFNANVEGYAAASGRNPEALQETMSELCGLLKCSNGDAAAQHIGSLMQACRLKTRLREVGVTRSDLPRLAASVNPERLKNNPREFSPQALGAILESVY
jgi:alcohol dehydrogenase class IV